MLKVGDKVKVKSIDWYNKNKNEFGSVDIGPKFIQDMIQYCGDIFTIEKVYLSDSGASASYRLKEANYIWVDAFFENKPNLLEIE